MLKYFYFFFILSVFSTSLFSQTHTISGYALDEKSSEALIGCNVYVNNLKKGTSTNAYGFYSITLPESKDSVELIISYIGYDLKIIRFILTSDIKLNITLKPTSEQLEQVEIKGVRNRENVESTKMSVIELPAKQIKELPAIFGEKDVLKALVLLPGVQSGREAFAGFYVRGGGSDQNLVLLDEAVLYNPFHLFNFFSVFNSDAIKNVQLIKGGFPAQYGGRLSSIVDISLKDGNAREYHGEGGIGFIASRLTVEGPIIKDKSSFMISGRRTYLDLLVNALNPNPEDGGGGVYFYDLNTKLNYKISENDRVFVSGYFGKDVLYSEIPSDSMLFQIDWGNKTLTSRWNHIFTKKLFSNTTFIYNDYLFRIIIERGNTEAKLLSGIRDVSGKIDFDYYPSLRHKIKWGFHHTYHTFIPSLVKGTRGTTPIPFPEYPQKFVNHSAGYINSDYSFSDVISLNSGLRVPFYKYKNFDYLNFEPRLAMKYSLNQTSSIKLSYTRMDQFVQLVTCAQETPLDLWVPSSDKIKPQNADQAAIGYFRNFNDNKYESSFETYYKKMNNITEYKEGADIFLNPNIEDFILFGEGWAYGGEFFIRKNEGRVNGWIGYTLSWSMRQIDGFNIGNEPYPAKYDRRHDLSVVAFYNFNKKWSFSAVFVYGTGNSVTLPVGRFSDPSYGWDPYFSWYSDYGYRNSFKMQSYNRLDLGIKKTVVKKRFTFVESFDIYNVYNRRNPFFLMNDKMYDPKTNSEKWMLRQFSIFGVIPTINFSIIF